MDISRWLDEQPPGVPEAVVALRDALVDYIRANESLADDFLFDGTITAEQAREANASPHMNSCRALLKLLERWEINPSLDGLVKMRR